MVVHTIACTCGKTVKVSVCPYPQWKPEAGKRCLGSSHCRSGLCILSAGARGFYLTIYHTNDNNHLSYQQRKWKITLHSFLLQIMFPQWNTGWKRNTITGRNGKLHHRERDKPHMQWDKKDISAQLHHQGISHLLEQMLGYWRVSSEPAAVHLRGSPLHDGLVHPVLHRQHLHDLLPVPLDKTLHQTEWKAAGSSPAREKQVRSGV